MDKAVNPRKGRTITEYKNWQYEQDLEAGNAQGMRKLIVILALALAGCETTTYYHYECDFLIDTEAETIIITSRPPGGEEYCAEVLEVEDEESGT